MHYGCTGFVSNTGLNGVSMEGWKSIEYQSQRIFSVYEAFPRGVEREIMLVPGRVAGHGPFHGFQSVKEMSLV
jgi:hypothetical protein